MSSSTVQQATQSRPLFAFYLPAFHSRRHAEAFVRRINDSMPLADVICIAANGICLLTIAQDDPDTAHIETWLRRVQWETMK